MRAAAEQVSGFFFGSTAAFELGVPALEMLARDAPFRVVSRQDVYGVEPFSSTIGEGTHLDVLKLLTASGLAPSNGAAKRLLEQGAVSVNKQKVSAADRYIRVLPDSLDNPFSLESQGRVHGVLLHGEYVVVGKGKRDFALLQVRG